MTFDLPTVQALVAHYARVQGLGERTFQVQIVSGLQHADEQGVPQDAWATVEDQGPGAPVLVSVRDFVATPVATFKGDLWTELKVTISHELWHLWVNALLADPSVENEEAFVEAAAQAVVRSAGADARVMARSIQAIPSAVRARAVKISARAVRARGGNGMDPKMVQDALEKLVAGDDEGCKAILMSLIAAAAGAGSGGAPAVDPVLPAGGATDMRPAMPATAAKPGDDAAPDSDEARKAMRKARQVMHDDDTKLRARQVAAVGEAEASAAILRTTTIRARIHEAREVDKATISPEAEKLILAAPSIGEAEIRLTLARGSAQTTTPRARAVDKGGNPVVVDTVTGDAPDLTGLSPQDVQMYESLGGDKSSAARTYVKEAHVIRARLAAGAKGDAS